MVTTDHVCLCGEPIPATLEMCEDCAVGFARMTDEMRWEVSAEDYYSPTSDSPGFPGYNHRSFDTGTEALEHAAAILLDQPADWERLEHPGIHTLAVAYRAWNVGTDDDPVWDAWEDAHYLTPFGCFTCGGACQLISEVTT